LLTNICFRPIENDVENSSDLANHYHSSVEPFKIRYWTQNNNNNNNDDDDDDDDNNM
jgi:hypothetical protein